MDILQKRQCMVVCGWPVMWIGISRQRFVEVEMVFSWGCKGFWGVDERGEKGWTISRCGWQIWWWCFTEMAEECFPSVEVCASRRRRRRSGRRWLWSLRKKRVGVMKRLCVSEGSWREFGVRKGCSEGLVRRWWRKKMWWVVFSSYEEEDSFFISFFFLSFSNEGLCDLVCVQDF